MQESAGREAASRPGASSLAGLASHLGSRIAAAANRPVLLDDPDSVWLIESGALDVFLVETEGGAAASGLSNLLRVGEDRVVFGVDSESFSLVAKGLPGSVIRRLRIDDLLREAAREDFAFQVDAWIRDFAATVASGVDPRPRPDLRITAGRSQDGLAGNAVFAHPGEVVWIERAGPAHYLGTEDVDSDDTALVPLTSDTWVVLDEASSLQCTSSRSVESGRLLEGLRRFHSLALSAELLNRRLQVADSANAQVDRANYHRRERHRSRRLLFSVLDSAVHTSEDQTSDIVTALNAAGRHENINFRWPPATPGETLYERPVHEILRESRVNYRRVRLSANDRWWRGDSGAMLAFRRDDDAPVALLPGRLGRYREFDPARNSSRRLNARRSHGFHPEAWSFCHSLPEDEQLTAGDVTRFGFSNTRAICVLLAVAGFLATLQIVLPAFLAGELAGRLVPPVSEGTTTFFGLVLVGMAVFSMLLLVLQGVLMTRVEGRVIARVSAGLVDRLMNLPLRFGRQFRAGDLMTRILNLWVLRDQFAGIVTQSVLVVVFLLPALALLLLYDIVLAVTSIAVAVFALAAMIAFGLPQTHHQRARFSAMRSVASQVNQYLGGIRKLRSAGAEDSAFGSVIRGIRDQLRARSRVDGMNRHLVAFSASVPMLGSTILFAVASGRGFGQDRASDFLVVYIVSIVIYSSIANLGRVFEGVTTALPIYEQIKPIVWAKPARVADTVRESASRVELYGELRFDNVSFRHDDTGPLILGGVTIEAKPGEFIAIVGHSGAGKSTLISLALGLEEPLSGAVYYDGRDLASISTHSVRRQVGMVSQDNALHPGNILQNIVGFSNDMTIEDAWRAAQLADIAEEIAAMPMQMFTPVGDNTATFSGGQQQRIQIAAALVRSPRFVFLDEATSWLDVNTQARVMQGIESLSATRLVIAHRLSTVRAADRIYVLAGGRVAQQGTFEELREADGPFRRLTERQLS